MAAGQERTKLRGEQPPAPVSPRRRRPVHAARAVEAEKVLRGDDGRVYFQMLSHDMKQLELQRLKAQAAKIPPKIRVYSFVMLVCFMLIYIVVILMQILTSMGGLFG